VKIEDLEFANQIARMSKVSVNYVLADLITEGARCTSDEIARIQKEHNESLPGHDGDQDGTPSPVGAGNPDAVRDDTDPGLGEHDASDGDPERGE